MAAGNTFGATALSSYGGFWIAFAIIFTPGGFDIQSQLVEADNGSMDMYYNSVGLFFMVNIYLTQCINFYICVCMYKD
jgi:succinate-acetate transporter protein